MNRRRFLKAFVGAVATVAIGLKLATPEPKWIGIDWARDPDTGMVWRYSADTLTAMARRRGKPVMTFNEYHRSVVLNPAALVRINTV